MSRPKGKNQKSNKSGKNVVGGTSDFKTKLIVAVSEILVNGLWLKNSTAMFLARIICSLLSCNGVWLKKIAQCCDGDQKVDSMIRRLQRFFGTFYFNELAFMEMVLKLVNNTGRIVLIIDRTSWCFGKKVINIFVASILVKKAGCNNSFAIPIAWKVFTKKGNSNTLERKQLLEKILRIIKPDQMDVFLADREFIGEEWFNFLLKNAIPFVIRIRNNMYVEYKEERIQIEQLAGKIKHGEKFACIVKLDGIKLRLMITRSSEGSLVAVVAPLNVTFDLLKEYGKRWFIELYFKSIKSQGFNLEETHMTDPSKINVLFGLLAFCSLIAVQMGMIRDEICKIRTKKHGRPAFSLFTYGLDFLRELFRNPRQKFRLPSCLASPPEILFLGLEKA